jgi:hypothetical protein
MGTMIGLVIGYVLGTRAGENGFQEFKEAWHTITTSDEVKDMVVGAASMARDLVQRGSEIVAEKLERTDGGAVLRSAA